MLVSTHPRFSCLALGGLGWGILAFMFLNYNSCVFFDKMTIMFHVLGLPWCIFSFLDCSMKVVATPETCKNRCNSVSGLKKKAAHLSVIQRRNLKTLSCLRLSTLPPVERLVCQIHFTVLRRCDHSWWPRNFLFVQTVWKSFYLFQRSCQQQ